MKNTSEMKRAGILEQEVPNWLYESIMDEDDFLRGKIQDFSPESWEEEEE